MGNIYRTHYNNELINISEKEVKVAGFIENIRDHGGVIFVDLRDSTSIIQLVSNDDSIFNGITKESSISATGVVRKRNEEDYNEKLLTGTIELLVSDIQILGKAKNVLPFEIINSKEVSEDVRLKYRYLDLRNEKVKDNIKFRADVIDYLREFMKKENFLEIQTPILTASSPEGARDFIIPARKHPGKFYALPQAPQQFKQLLMCSGFDKYFQIAPCFRDEDARSDRVYGEFYQLDLEMAFATEEDVLKIGESIFYNTFKKFGGENIISDKPFKRLTYKESMELYGTDKPDLRNPLLIKDVTKVFKKSSFRPFRGVTVKSIKIENIYDLPNSWYNELVDYASSIGMPGIGYFKVNENLEFLGPIEKFLSDEEKEELIQECELKAKDVIFFIADKRHAYKYSSLIRDELGKKLNLIKDNEFVFCIIKDFPMYEYNEEDKKYDFTHNPFSMPKGEIESLNNLDPEQIIAHQYDFVCNGIEVASGAVRNHNPNVMLKAFEIAGYTEDEILKRFSALYEAFKYGAPPHAGMAPGIDRILMLLKNEENIRETIAFPLNASGVDNLTKAPSAVSDLQLKQTHIKLK